MIQNVSDPQQGLEELIRILGGKGMLAVTSLARVLPLQELVKTIDVDYHGIAFYKDLAEEDDGIVLQLG